MRCCGIGFFSNCGGDFTFRNNLFVDVGATIRQSGRKEFGSVRQTLWDRLHAVPFTSPVWRQRYPELNRRFKNWANGTAPPVGTTEPLNNRFTCNVAVNITGLTPVPGEGPISRFHNWTANADGIFSLPAPFWTPNASNTTQFFDIRGGNAVMTKPGFVCADPGADLNFTLEDTSPLFALGWQAIPESDIGPTWTQGLV